VFQTEKGEAEIIPECHGGDAGKAWRGNWRIRGTNRTNGGFFTKVEKREKGCYIILKRSVSGEKEDIFRTRKSLGRLCGFPYRTDLRVVGQEEMEGCE